MSVVSVEGLKGSGKSTFAATWKREEDVNCFWFDFDRGAKRALVNLPHEEQEAHHEIWHPSDEVMANMLETLDFVRGDTVQGQEETWTNFTKKFKEIMIGQTPLRPENVLWAPDVLIFDTWKFCWSCNTMAYLQGLQRQVKSGDKKRTQLTEKEYGVPNNRMDNLVALGGSQKDIILVSHLRPQYIPYVDENGVNKTMPDPSGKTEIDGYKHTVNRADWQLEFRVDPAPPAKPIHFKMVITKSPIGAELVGFEIERKIGEGLLDYALVKAKIEEEFGKEMS